MRDLANGYTCDYVSTEEVGDILCTRANGTAKSEELLPEDQLAVS